MYMQIHFTTNSIFMHVCITCVNAIPYDLNMNIH